MSSSPSTCTRLTTWTTLAVLLQMIGVTLFVLGFFPVKPTISGVSGSESYRAPECNSMDEDHKEANHLPPDRLRALYEEMSEIPPSFDRLILMVVDGLPAEFVLGKGGQLPTKARMEAMPYTQSLLSRGMAIGYHAKAAPPTVTMPRLKAMVSGAIGGFLDVAFNFNTQVFADDNLLGQLYNIGWKMVMLGDETWIKLFPTLFSRHDGVSSFYVKDTVEVDQNVSRHLGDELVTNDWNLLILHYLGLDHVGHIGGRSSTLMLPKLREMDEVIKKIHMTSVLPQDDFHGRTLLVVVSDHGMTDNGNHGGSSYEETDSLALFIGLGSKLPGYASTIHNAASQVDLAPTIALLFGVPIPKNNVGVLMAEVFDSLTDGQKLRALELNSWQLLRLLQVQLSSVLCNTYLCGDILDQTSGSRALRGSVEELHCSFSKATSLHHNWISQQSRNSGSNSRDNFVDTIAAYYEFLRAASEWLSRRATDKPPGLLIPGIAILVVSCVTFFIILIRLIQEVYFREKQYLLASDNCAYQWHLDEAFILAVLVILVSSMGSSSMVEEEQYIWHFFTSTLYLIYLRKSIQAPPASVAPSSNKEIKGHNYSKYSQTWSIVLVLICGRILRGWHQGGVNWVHLPDISKCLEHSGPHVIKLIQIVSALLIIILSSFALYFVRSKGTFGLVVQVSLFIPGLLILVHIMEYQEHIIMLSNYSSTSIAQMIYSILSIIVAVSALYTPWTTPISVGEADAPSLMMSPPVEIRTNSLMRGLRNSLYLIGWTYTTSWCFLQLLLQQPINAMPIFLLLSQLVASTLYFSAGGRHHKQWAEVAAMYFLGIAGHFSLGNSNTLATIDVAGAFIGLSSHSTVLSGVIMFIITFASPLFFLLSTLIYTSSKDTGYLVDSLDGELGHLIQMVIGFPCLVPLTLNSVLLTSFTIVLLLMRNHLFVWSVFSPKYLYVFATTICVYIGVFIVAATGIYTCSVCFFRSRMLTRKGNGRKLR